MTPKTKQSPIAEPLYEDRIVLFVDILGFKQLIDSTLDKDGSEIFERTRKLQDILNVFKNGFIGDSEIAKSKRVTQFSDSIVVSWRYEEKSQVFYTFLDILHAHMEILYLGELIRGAVTVGKLHHSENLIFGPGLVRAYELETQAAIFPRVIIEPSAIVVGSANAIRGHTEDIEQEHLHDLSVLDSDGQRYIDYFAKAQTELNYPNEMWPEYLDKIREITLKGLKSNSPGVRNKFCWVREKYNALIAGYKSPEALKHIRENFDEDFYLYFANLELIPE